MPGVRVLTPMDAAHSTGLTTLSFDGMTRETLMELVYTLYTQHKINVKFQYLETMYSHSSTARRDHVGMFACLRAGLSACLRVGLPTPPTPRLLLTIVESLSVQQVGMRISLACFNTMAEVEMLLTALGTELSAIALTSKAATAPAAAVE